MLLLIFLVWSEEVSGGSFPNLTIFRTPRPKLYAGGDFRSLKIENYLPKYNHEINDHRTHSQVRFQSPCFDDSAKCLHNSSDTRTRLNQHTVGRCTNGAAAGSEAACSTLNVPAGAGRSGLRRKSWPGTLSENTCFLDVGSDTCPKQGRPVGSRTPTPVGN